MNEQGFQIPNSLTEMLDNMGIEDPRLRLFAEMMEKQSTTPSAESSLEEKLARKKRALARIERLSRENQELREENQWLRERLEFLAASLGACPDCWGEDQSCSICQGMGAPGSFLPDRDAFAAYVVPATRTIQRFTHRNRGSKPDIGKDTPDTQKKTPVNE